jgi:hypothetical protein
MLIDCDACTARGPACGDCVVTVLLRTVPTVHDTGGVELDGAEQAALVALAGSGLVPPLRLVPAVERDTTLASASRYRQMG